MPGWGGGGACAWVLYTCDCDEAESKGACPPDPHGLPVILSSRWDARPCWWGISRRSMHRGSCLRNFRSRTIPPPLTQRWRSPICKVACQTLDAGASGRVEQDISKAGRSFPGVHRGSRSQKVCEHVDRPNVSPSVHSAPSLESRQELLSREKRVSSSSPAPGSPGVTAEL